MSFMTSRFVLLSLCLLLAAVLLAGCPIGAETRLRGYAQDFVTALDINILEENHHVLIAPIHMDEPASSIFSEYIVSDSPQEIKDKLRALHLAEEGWIAPNDNRWIGPQVSSLSPRHATPEEMKERFERVSLPEGDSAVDFFLICPWYRDYSHDEGKRKSYISVFYYPHYVILTNSGKLVVLIRDTMEWSSLCLTQAGLNS